MKTIIAGSSKGITFEQTMTAITECPWEITSVVSGRASGVDEYGETFAVIGRYLPLHVYPADWERYKKAAGPIRNKEMAENAEALLAVWDGKSPGTKNMINTARKLKLMVHIIIIGGSTLEGFY